MVQQVEGESRRDLMSVATLTAFGDDPARPGVGALARALGGGLPALLLARAAVEPDAVAFVDQPDRESWSGRPRLHWSADLAATAVMRLSTQLRALGLRPGAAIGILMPNIAETSLTLAAICHAGFKPSFIPLGGSDPEIMAALRAGRVEAAVTVGRVADLAPAALLSRLAATYFGLRFLCAFGPDVPDGVIDLDEIIVAGAIEPTEARTGSPALATLERHGGDPAFKIHRIEDLIAESRLLIEAAGIGPGERVLSLLAPDDLAGIVAGPLAALCAGAAYESHGLFDSAALVAALLGEPPAHLVVPGWMAADLALSGVDALTRSVILVRDADEPAEAPALAVRTVDLVALDEEALLILPPADGAEHRSGPPAGSRWRLAPDGRIEIAQGPGAWGASRYRAEIEAGQIAALLADPRG